jgi:Uncharacterised nucleotidyltransferase
MLDREIELLLRCCAASAPLTGPAARSALVESGINWDRFIALADRNCVTPLVAARLYGERDCLPSEVAQKLRMSYAANARRSLRLASCAENIFDSLDADGVAAIAIKGPTLAMAAYGDLALRVFSDLDVMVHQADLARAAGILARIGYTSSAYDETAIASGFFPDVALNFAREDSIVDLHWRLAPSYFPFAPEGEQLWQQTVEIELPGRRIRSLGPRDAILFQACHGSKHGWTTLAHICDFAGLLAVSTPADLDGLADEARRIGSLRMVLLGADLAHSLSLCEVPARLLEVARQDSSVASLSRTVRRYLFDPARDSAFDEWRIALGTIETLGGRLRYLIERIGAPKLSDRELMPLPVALYPLYYLARPFSVVLRHSDMLFDRRRS